MLGDNSIEARGLLIHNGFPIKTYIFSQDFDRVYRTPEEALKEVSDSLDYEGFFDRYAIKDNKCYAISFPWSDIYKGEAIKMLGVYNFSFDFDKDWDECNPEWESFIFSNGILNGSRSSGCETGLIILGKEGELRRKIADEGGNRDKYIYDWPDIGNLGPKNIFVPVIIE